MPSRLDRKTIVALVVAVIVIGLYAAAVSAARSYYSQTAFAGSTFSRGQNGLSVLYQYLDELGVRPVALQRFDVLPEPSSATIVFAAEDVIVNPPTAGESERLAEWVRRGGRLVLVGREAGRIADELELGASGRSGEASNRRLQPIVPSPEAVGAIRPGDGRLLASDSDWVAHYKDIDGQVLLSTVEGRGEVWWLASVYAVSNRGIGEERNGDLAVAVVTGSKRRPYFDEYHHGYVRGGGLWERLRSRGRAAALVVLAALAVAMFAWGRRLGPAIPQVERPVARSTAYIGQLAELYRKAGARGEALLSLEDGVNRALARRYGTLAAGLSRRPAVAEALAAAATARERGVIGQDEFVAVADKLRLAREEVEGARWVTSRR